MLLKMKNRGFTLVELVLSLAIISIITLFSVPVFRSLLVATDLNTSTDILVHSVRRAQNLSRSTRLNERWGVKLNSNEIVIFAGDAYVSRIVDYDEVYDVSNGINFTGDTEFVFQKLSGFLDNTVNITVSNSFGSNDLEVSTLGTVEY